MANSFRHLPLVFQHFAPSLRDVPLANPLPPGRRLPRPRQLRPRPR